MSREINEDDFDESVEDGLTLVECYRNGCVPCKNFSESISDIEQEIPNLNIFTLNIEENMEIAAEFKIMSVPTFLLFEDGELIWQGSAYNGKDSFVNLIESFIGE